MSTTAPQNNIGFLRLVLASLVIIGHAPELIDGNRAREPMTMLFHTLSLGEMAVNGFFLISGYLITKSALQSPSSWDYLKKRILRIYPAFIMAYLVMTCILIPALHVPASSPAMLLVQLFTLYQPARVPIKTLAYPFLNGAMWTLSYEFRCYIFVLILNIAGLLKRKYFILALATAGWLLTIAISFAATDHLLNPQHENAIAFVLLGTVDFNIRFLACFITGSVVFLFRDIIDHALNVKTACACLVLLIIGLFSNHTAQAGFDLFGGLLLYVLAFKANFGRLRNINSTWDISYGTYLYGWPAATCLIFWLRIDDPAILSIATLPIAWSLGAASWLLIEKPAIALAHGRSRQHVTKAIP